MLTALIDHRKIMFIAAVAVVTYLMVAAPASACLCVTARMKWEFKRHDVVIIGRIEEVFERGGAAYHRIRVIKALKDTAEQVEVTVRTETPQASSCGFIMPEGQTRVVMAHREPDGQIVAGMCSNPPQWGAPRSLSLAERRAWWWRLGISSVGWHRLTHPRRW